MAASTGGTDFWAALGVDREPAEEAPDQPPAPAGEKQAKGKAPNKPGGKRRNGAKQARTPPAPQAGTASGAPADWASLFSDGLRAPEGGTSPSQPSRPAETPLPQRAVEPQKAEPQKAEPEDVTPEPTVPESATAPATNEPATDAQAPETPGARASNGQGNSGPGPDPAWVAAERIAATIEARLRETWLEVLMRHTDGDRVLAGRVYQVLHGRHLLGELWLDKRINEVHVRGTRVTVCAADGVYEVPGFPSRASARKAVAAIESTQAELGAIVTQVGDSYVLNRPYDTGPGAESLLSSGVVTQELLERVREALQRLEAVTVTGPAARTVVRAFASLIPSGSRVFVGPFTVLPDGCIAAKGPLDADYVTGVRPGPVAEDMAAAGQVGALIANPETQFPAAVRLVVTGRSLAPEKVSLH
ncbi:hypothetical protein [Actinomadura verrucosospora]|uniref:Cell wall surface anchor family protein n=1 Tax=Actinomadura verrucosospora TaxID=46165 RepID=A0A7D3ZLU3_ACTVE|nr:hypothetical protein [Actinomadura verrucosospora]QKG23341.1 cell wall surface anchor family protein [Actinomadura verrucosospora]